MTKNGLPDMVILAETIQGRELIAILKEKKGLKAFSLWTGPASNGMHLRCESAQVSERSRITHPSRFRGPPRMSGASGLTI
jgi:phage-related protein